MSRIHAASCTLSVRVASSLRKQLDEIATAEGRTRSFIAEEALKRYVKEESWQVQAIHSALEKAESKEARFAEHGAVKDWLKTWGTTKKSVPPKCK